MNKLGKLKTSFISSVFGLFLYLINLGLCLLLAINLLVFSCLYLNLKFSLPFGSEDFLKEELAKQGVILEAKSIKFDLYANIIVEDASLKFKATASDFMRLKSLSLGLSLDSLLQERLVLNYIILENATLSPVDIEAEELSLVSGINILAFRQGERWDIRNFKAVLGGLSVNIKGSIDRRYFLDADVDDDEVNLADSLEAWEDLSHKLNIAKSYADTLNYPTLFLDFYISKDNIESLYSVFRAKDVEMPIGEHHLSLSNFRLAFGLDAKDMASGQAKILIRAKDFDLNSKISSEIFNLRSTINFEQFEGIEDIYLSDLYLWVDDFSFGECHLEHISMNAKEFCLDETPKGLDFYIKRDSSYLDLTLSVDKNIINVDFDYSDNPFSYLDFPSLQELKDLKIMQELSLSSDLYLNGRASVIFEEDIDMWDLHNLDFEKFEAVSDVKMTAFLLGQDVKFANKNVEEVYARIDLDLEKDYLLFKDIYLITSEDWSINGEFYQGIESLDYIINVEGNFEPSCLDNLMADWWEMVFNSFDLLEYPDVGVFVKGKWGDPAFTWVYADIEVAKAKYHSYPFEDISLQLNVNPAMICAYDVKLNDADGFANACLYWNYDPNLGLKRYIDRGIIANLNMNYKAIEALGGEDVEEILDLIEFDNDVFIEFSLNTLNSRIDPYYEQEIDFKFNSKDPIKVSYFDFDSIGGIGNAKGDSFYIKNISAKFFDGELYGDFSIEKREGKQYFKTKLDATNLNQGKLLDLISEIANEDDSNEDIDESNYLGKVKSSLSAEGFLLDFNSYKAQANIVVENDELKKINILGGLSRVLEGVGIPLTTLEFREFTGEFSLEDSEIYFSNFELKSPVSTSFGKATYEPMTDELSARMYFNWKVSSSIPIIGHIADFAFDPILDSILIVISDTLSDPSFSPRIRPFNIFNSSKTMIENIDKDSL